MGKFNNFQQHRAKNYVYQEEKRPHIPKEIRLRVLRKFDGCCYLCGEEPKRLCVDHVRPYAISKDNSESNLMPICTSCNLFKGLFSLEELRRELSMQLKRAEEKSVNYRMAKKFYQLIENPHPIEFHFERFKK